MPHPHINCSDLHILQFAAETRNRKTSLVARASWCRKKKRGAKECNVEDGEKER